LVYIFDIIIVVRHFIKILLLLISSASLAAVNVNNGNFFVSYTDFIFKSNGLNIQATRTYNSRSNYVKGLFGIGWSSNLESFLRIEKNNILYFEGGGGNQVKFIGKGKVFSSKSFGENSLKFDGKLYNLKLATGNIQTFNKKGLLIKEQDSNGSFYEFIYKDGALSGIKDNLGNQLGIQVKKFGGFNRVTRISIEDQVASYSYSKNGKLLTALNSLAAKYSYSYDDEFNMTKISFGDGSFMEMAYNKYRDWVISFRDYDGTLTKYDYYADKLDPELKFGTNVSRKIAGKAKTENSKFWYEFKKRSNGTQYNYRSLSLLNNVVTETIYTECCGTPLVISQWNVGKKINFSKKNLAWTQSSGNKNNTRFEYFKDGLLKRKIYDSGRITELTYEPKMRKIASITTDGAKVSYNYDRTGNLVKVNDSANNSAISINYDSKGLISNIIEKKKNVLSNNLNIRYDLQGRPVEIKSKNKQSPGNIFLKYTKTGDLLGIVNSKGERFSSADEIKRAQTVASSFQNLLSLVQPKGLDLTP